MRRQERRLHQHQRVRPVRASFSAGSLRVLQEGARRTRDQGTLVENIRVAAPASPVAGDLASGRVRRLEGAPSSSSARSRRRPETGNPTGSAGRIGWALTNTSSLDAATPAWITSRLINSQTYVFPPSDQQTGDFPLGECINDTTMATPFGPGCWQLLFVDEPAHDEVIDPDSLDTRMQQTWFRRCSCGGRDGGQRRRELKAGIVVRRRPDQAPARSRAGERQGYVALANNNLSMPAIAWRRGQRGDRVHILGEDLPTRLRTSTQRQSAPSTWAGRLDDGFTSYKAFVGDPPHRGATRRR